MIPKEAYFWEKQFLFKEWKNKQIQRIFVPRLCFFFSWCMNNNQRLDVPILLTWDDVGWGISILIAQRYKSLKLWSDDDGQQSTGILIIAQFTWAFGSGELRSTGTCLNHDKNRWTVSKGSTESCKRSCPHKYLPIQFLSISAWKKSV